MRCTILNIDCLLMLQVWRLYRYNEDTWSWTGHQVISGTSHKALSLLSNSGCVSEAPEVTEEFLPNITVSVKSFLNDNIFHWWDLKPKERKRSGWRWCELLSYQVSWLLRGILQYKCSRAELCSHGTISSEGWHPISADDQQGDQALDEALNHYKSYLTEELRVCLTSPGIAPWT